MKGLVSPQTIFKAILVLIIRVHIVQCTSAKFLWQVIDRTIERKTPTKGADWNPSNCPRLIFHNNQSLVPEEFIGNRSVTLDLTGVNEPNFRFRNMSDAMHFLSFEVNETIRLGDTTLDLAMGKGDPTMRKLYEPCVSVISIVNTTNMNFNKLELSKLMIELLQFNTPVRNRYLILVRLAEKDEELFDCAVFKGAAEFPTRRMSIWEMLLFDFFTDAQVIQGVAAEHHNKGKNTLRVGLDPGMWVWLCDDIIEKLREKKECLAQNKSKEECRIWKKLSEHNGTCERGFSPRH